MSGIVRENASAARCLSHLRECGMLLRASATDRNGSIPLFHYILPGSSRTWADFLVDGGYLNRRSAVQLCPVASPRQYHNDRGAIYGAFLPAASQYDALPHHYRPESGPDAGTLFMRLNTVEEPSRYWVLADSWHKGQQKQFYVISEGTESRVHLRHRELANFLFADGHVRALGPQQILDLPHVPLRRGFDQNENLIQF